MKTDWSSIIAAYTQSGQSIKAFCLAQGLKAGTFHYHYQQQKRKTVSGFVQVTPTVAELTCPVEIEYPNGVRLKLHGKIDYQQIRALLHV